MTDTIDQAPTAGADDADPPEEAGPDQPLPPSEIPELAEVLKQAKALPWGEIDMECPPASIRSSGGEILQASATIRCNCGAEFVLPLSDPARHACPTCREPFRHVLIVQGENFYPSAVSLALHDIIEAQDL